MKSPNHIWLAKQAVMRARRISDALTARPMTRLEIAHATGQSRRTVDTHVTRLHAAGEIHVIKWLRQESGIGVFLQVFALGAGKDAPKPRPKTPSELAKRQRRKVKADPLRRLHDLQQARKRETRRARKTTPTDPFLSQFAGLFGQRQAA